MIDYKPFREQFIQCGKIGNRFIVQSPSENCGIIVCVKYKTFCNSGACRKERMPKINAKGLAILFHNIYERLAPEYGYETRNDTMEFNENTPNGKLMIAVCSEILVRLKGSDD